MTRRMAASLQEIAEVIGDDGVARLVAAVGGTEVYIPAPHRVHADHWLAEAVGLDAARRLAAHLQYHGPNSTRGSGCKIHVPVMHRLKKELILASSGTNRAVALRVRCTERYVSQVRRMAQRRA